jgi:hypothetical protein
VRRFLAGMVDAYAAAADTAEVQRPHDG